MEPTALPCASVWMLPRSPTWRSSSFGAPWVLEKGLTVDGQRISTDYAYFRARSSQEGENLTVRTGRGAAIGVVAELVDVEATLGIGILASDVPGDGGWRGLGRLLEGDSALDVGVTAEDSNCEGEALAHSS